MTVNGPIESPVDSQKDNTEGQGWTVGLPVKRSNGWVGLAAPIHKFPQKVMGEPHKQPIITDHVSSFAHPTDSCEIHRLTWNRRSPTKYIQVSSHFFLPFTFIFFAPKNFPQRFCFVFLTFSPLRVSFSPPFFRSPTPTAKLLHYAPPRENFSSFFTDSSQILFIVRCSFFLLLVASL